MWSVRIFRCRWLPGRIDTVYFKGFEFRGFREFMKNREIKSQRKICNWAICEIKSSVKKIEKYIYFLNNLIQSLFDTKRRPWLIYQT